MSLTIGTVAAENTGSMGDGKFFVLPIEECVRIRTGGQGPDAIGGRGKYANKFKGRPQER